MRARKIESLDKLKELCKDGQSVECFIAIGYARSSKEISYDENRDEWRIIHEIDDTETVCKTSELKECTNIPDAIERGAFFQYLWE